jgi:hypothetical protein
LAFRAKEDIFSHNARLGINRGGYGGDIAKYTLHVFVSSDIGQIDINCQLPNSVRKIVVQIQGQRSYYVHTILSLDLLNQWQMKWQL